MRNDIKLFAPIGYRLSFYSGRSTSMKYTYYKPPNDNII